MMCCISVWMIIVVFMRWSVSVSCYFCLLLNLSFEGLLLISRREKIKFTYLFSYLFMHSDLQFACYIFLYACYSDPWCRQYKICCCGCSSPKLCRWSQFWRSCWSLLNLPISLISFGKTWFLCYSSIDSIILEFPVLSCFLSLFPSFKL